MSLLRIVAVVALVATATLAAPVMAPAQDSVLLQNTYVLGPNDELTIRALDAEEISDKTYRVSSDGDITLPMIGRFKAAGMTLAQLESQLVTALEKYIRKPKVALTVTEFRSQPVSVWGSVMTPGVVQLQGAKTLVEILSMAGGVRSDAGHSVMVTRQKAWGPLPLPGARPDATGEFVIAEVNLKDVLEARRPEHNIKIRPNDIISVPRAEIVYVLGTVKKAGSFPMNERGGLSVMEALALAEGHDRTADLKKAKIRRLAPGAMRRVEVAVDVKEMVAGKASDVALEPNDILYIPDSSQKRAAFRVMEALMSIGTTAGAGAILYR
jgi:polysaccharide export outer membrane protein